MLESVTHESFESIIGKIVELTAGEACFRADVKEVRLLRQNPGRERQPFSLILWAHDANNHGQQIYQVSHPELGDLSLFLVPIGPDDHRMQYEAVFN